MNTDVLSPTLPFNSLNLTCKFLSFKSINNSPVLFHFLSFLSNFMLSFSFFSLPIKNKLKSLIKSPFVHKKAGRQFFKAIYSNILVWLLANVFCFLPIHLSFFFKNKLISSSISHELAKILFKFFMLCWKF